MSCGIGKIIKTDTKTKSQNVVVGVIKQIFVRFLDFISYPKKMWSAKKVALGINDVDFADKIKYLIENHIEINKISEEELKSNFFIHMPFLMNYVFGVTHQTNNLSSSFKSAYSKVAYIFFYQYMNDLNINEKTVIKNILIIEEMCLEKNKLSNRAVKVVFDYILAGINDAGLINQPLNKKIKKYNRIRSLIETSEYLLINKKPLMIAGYKWWFYRTIPYFIYALFVVVYFFIFRKPLADFSLGFVKENIFMLTYTMNALLGIFPMVILFFIIRVYLNSLKLNINKYNDNVSNFNKTAVGVHIFGNNNLKRYLIDQNKIIKKMVKDIGLPYILITSASFVIYYYNMLSTPVIKSEVVTSPFVAGMYDVIISMFVFFIISLDSLWARITTNTLLTNLITRCYASEYLSLNSELPNFSWLIYKKINIKIRADIISSNSLFKEMKNIYIFIDCMVSGLWNINNNQKTKNIEKIYSSVTDSTALNYYEKIMLNKDFENISVAAPVKKKPKKI